MKWPEVAEVGRLGFRGFGVLGFWGFRVWGLGFRGLGSGVWGLWGFGVLGVWVCFGAGLGLSAGFQVQVRAATDRRRLNAKGRLINKRPKNSPLCLTDPTAPVP